MDAAGWVSSAADVGVDRQCSHRRGRQSSTDRRMRSWNLLKKSGTLAEAVDTGERTVGTRDGRVDRAVGLAWNASRSPACQPHRHVGVFDSDITNAAAQSSFNRTAIALT